MTTANKITVARILMIPAFVTMAIYYGQSIQRHDPLEWQRFTAIAIFLIAAVSDGLDGYIARRYKQRSALGAILDPIADKGLLLSGIITLSISNWSEVDPEYGRFPAWFPVLVITRDAVILVGAGILHYFIGNKMRIKPSWTGKVATVHDQPGITRDRISAICSRGEQPFTLWDTGGIFGAGEKELTVQVRQTAEGALRESDLLLFVVDGKDGLSPIDSDLARTLRKARKPIVLVVNKIDHDKHESLAAEFDSLGFEKIVSISAEHNRGISDLLGVVDQLLPSPAQSVSQPSLVTPERSEGGTLNSQPLAIAIIGRPNVGKSSLINAIVQSERAI